MQNAQWMRRSRSTPFTRPKPRMLCLLHLLQELLQPFHWDRKGEEDLGAKPYLSFPVISFYKAGVGP